MIIFSIRKLNIYFEFSCLGFSCSQDKRKGISNNILLFFTLTFCTFTCKISFFASSQYQFIYFINWAYTFFRLLMQKNTLVLLHVQCSRCLAIHIARPLKNGGALPIFHANPSYFDNSEIQSSDFQWVDLA